ncbi:MAG TPA: thioredoxin domain-containing protein [Gaiellaceae bacterium]|nr:thioredoxin domain-containing protein [Gaiellaceae bacterium]
MNRLSGETSPYLLQHAENPVDWYPWGEEAFERARSEDRPIFLSIGYSACHWCHVMEHESFAIPATAELMNESFVCVKVDREERPDVDSVYMDAAVALTRSGGWPLNLFLTPEGKPFWAATYLPPVPRSGLRSFGDILQTVARAWKDNREELEKSGDSLTEHLRKVTAQEPVDAPVEESLVKDAIEALTYGFDWQWGGWGTAPKFPPAPALEFLLRRDVPRMPEKTLDSMALGGMYDLVGGGFHRYSVDQRWLVPHFEKMLYDNAQLAVAYLHGWQVTGKASYRRIVEQTVGYMLRELLLEGGGFASAQDADTAGKEGLTFTWTRSEGDIPDEMLNIFEGGRFIIRGELDEAKRAELFELREKREKPARDDKAVASWNGLALAALSECGRVLDRPDWVEAARALGEFLLGPLSSADGRLHRTWREGVAKGNGYLEDYADVANGLLELHAASGDLRYLEEANRLVRLAVGLFYDEEHGGFFQTPADGEQLVVRRKDFDDHPAPSGNSMMAYVLLRLSRIYGDDELEAKAVSVFKLMLGGMQNAPSSFAWGLVGVDLHLSKRREIAIAGPPTSEVAKKALRRWDPNAVIAFGPADGIPLLAGKGLVDGKPAVYVCERFTCQAPATDPRDLWF